MSDPHFIFVVQIFRTMESLGLSLDDATKVMTVSSAFRNAKSDKDGSSIEAIDELTSRLNSADLSHNKGRSRSPSPSPSASSFPSSPTGNVKSDNINNESVDSLQINPNPPSAVQKKGQRPSERAAKSQQQQQGRGRKRALTEKTPEKCDNNASADVEAKEKKMLNAKLSSKAADGGGKKPKSSSGSRTHSPDSGGLGMARGKRSAAPLHVESEPKRPRTRSQTEESILPI